MTQDETRQPFDILMNELSLSNAALVQASTEQLSFKNVQKGRKGHRLTPNIQDKILNALLTARPGLKLNRRDLFRYEMSESSIEKIRQAKILIGEGKIDYPQFVDKLLEAGVTRYSVEIATHEITFFGSGGEALVDPGPALGAVSIGRYDEDAIRAAISASQKKLIDHPTFLKRIHAAGIVRYEANLRSREIRYRSESMTYKELIPLATPIAPEAPKKQVPPAAKKPAVKKKSIKRSVSLKARKLAKKSWVKRK